MEKKLRTRAEVESMIRKDFGDLSEEFIQALTTINLTDEEQLADLRQRCPSATEEALLKFAKDEETLAHAVLDEDIEEGMWQAQIDEDLSGEEESEWVPEF